eukprot:gene679-62109_t
MPLRRMCGFEGGAAEKKDEKVKDLIAGIKRPADGTSAEDNKKSRINEHFKPNPKRYAPTQEQLMKAMVDAMAAAGLSCTAWDLPELKRLGCICSGFEDPQRTKTIMQPDEM